MKNFTIKLFNKTLPLMGLVLLGQLGFSQDLDPRVIIPTEPACVFYEGDYNGQISRLRSPQVMQRMAGGGTPCSNFIVTYNGFTPEAQAAFQFAVDIWSVSLESPIPIRINANFQELGAGVLGSAGPSAYRTSNAPGAMPNVFYPNAIWEKLENEDSDELFGSGESIDINCNFSSTFNFYFGTDANPPNGQFDFVSVVLHELGHGLGFSGFGRLFDNMGTTEGAIRQSGSPRPSIFDVFIENGDNASILSFADPSVALLDEFEGDDLFCNSPAATIENGGTFPPTFAPSTFNSGSSYSHWREATYLAGDINSLMTPQIGPGEANHNPGPITLGFFEDMGWSLCSTLSVEDFELVNVEVSPNPFTSSLTINLTNSLNGDYNINLYDINGRTVKSENASSVNGSVSLTELNDLQDALYFVKITNVTSGQSITKKVIKK